MFNSLILAALDITAAAHPGTESLALAALLGELNPEHARAVLLRLRLNGRDVESVVALVAAAPEPYASTWADADVRRYMGQVPAELLPELLELRFVRAAAAAAADPDAPAREAGLAERVERQQAAASPLTLGELAVDGRDLRETLGVPEGPVIGAILERLLADVIEEPSLNTRMTLLTRASLILDELMQRSGSATGPARPSIR